MTASLALAVAFLTRLPVGRWAPASVGPAELSRAAWWFPAVGVLVGAVAGGVGVLALWLGLDGGPAAVLAVAAGALLTGGLHEDGLADCADALGAHVAPERRREILKDPRNGTFGTLALVLATLLAVTLLAPLSQGELVVDLMAAHAIGRWTVLLHVRLVAGDAGEPAAGLGASLQVGPAAVAVNLFGVVVLAVLVGGAEAGPFAVALAAVLTAGLAPALHRAFGSLRGDSLGAVLTLAVLASLAVLVP